MPPDLGAQPGGVQAHGVDPGADEDVRHRLPVTQAEHLVAVAIVEYAQRPGPRRFHAEHYSSVAGPGAAMSADARLDDHGPATRVPVSRPGPGPGQARRRR